MAALKLQQVKIIHLVIGSNRFSSKVTNQLKCHAYVPYRQVNSRAGVSLWDLSTECGAGLPGRWVGTPEEADS